MQIIVVVFYSYCLHNKIQCDHDLSQLPKNLHYATLDAGDTNLDKNFVYKADHLSVRCNLVFILNDFKRLRKTGDVKG